MGNAARPKQEISILDGLWTITTSTPVTKVKLQFELDKEFDETTADGRKVKVSGDCMTVPTNVVNVKGV